MKISKVTIKNFRSIEEESFYLDNYSLLVGENNAGKSNISRALRVFYGKEKFSKKDDLPKFYDEEDRSDLESWIEIEYELTDEEYDSLAEKYQNEKNKLKLKKFFQTGTSKKKGRIYGFNEENELHDEEFYGTKNVSHKKIGNLVYIPELNDTSDVVKTSGPSPLRGMLNFVMKKVLKDSGHYDELEEAFGKFNEEFSEEESEDGLSLQGLIDDINESINDWSVEFDINFNPIEPKELVKRLTSHDVIDKKLDEDVDIEDFGQGLQRTLIYNLIKLSSKYEADTSKSKEDFDHDFTLIIFEEPENFLHPNQQESLNIDLRSLAEEDEQQVLATTHSNIFVGNNTEDLSSLLRVNKKDTRTKVYQLLEDDISSLFDANTSMFDFFRKKLKDSSVHESVQNSIENMGLADDSTEIDMKVKEESLKFFLWMNSERANALFAKHIIICEGPSEKIFLDFLVSKKWPNVKSKSVYFLNAEGKYNIHRYMNLFKMLGINHSVLYDKDTGGGSNQIKKMKNVFVEDQKNKFTKGMFGFDSELEDFLGIDKLDNSEKHKKPINIMLNYREGNIDQNKIDDLKKILENELKININN